MRQRLVTAENKKWWTLAAVSVGLFVIMLDNTVVNVALPSMQKSLGMTLSELEWVVAGYALTFAALMNPATLSIITATFPPRQRGTAIGIWAGVSAMALAIGPLVGGLLTEHVNWNWIFFINVPIGIAGLLAIPLFVDESRDTSHEQKLDA